MKPLSFIHSIVRLVLFLLVVLFGASVFFVDYVPANSALSSASTYLLLIVLAFGIIDVRLRAPEHGSRDREHQRVWPYVVGGITALVGVVYWVTAPWPLVTRIGVGAYAAAILATLLLIVLEE